MKYLKILSMFCIFCFVFILSSCNIKNYSNLPSGSETETPVKDDEDMELNDNEGGFMKIKIDNTIFEISLEKNSTADSFYDMLPQSLNMNELNGNEKYCYLDSSLPANSEKTEKIYAGDIMLWGNNCIVIFYETFSSGYSYSKIGKIVDTTNLKKCLGSGSVVVDFIK